MKRRTRSLQLPDAHINLTSLLDITFVLLISFMVVAPALRYNVDLELPKVQKSRQVDQKKPVTIGVTYSETSQVAGYFVNGDAVALEDLPEIVKSREDYDPNKSVALEADRSVPWENIAKLINDLKLNDIHNLGIVTERGE